MTGKGPTDFNDQADEQGRQHIADQVAADLSALDAEPARETMAQPQAFVGEIQENVGEAASTGDPPPPDDAPPNAARGHDDDWEELFEINQTGKPKASVRNVELVLNNHPDWRGVLGYCEFSYRIVKRKAPPMQNSSPGEWDDSDAAALRVWMSYTYEFTPTHTDITDALMVVSRRNPFHPVREWLNGLKWDGTPRLSKWLQDAFESTDDSEYLGVIGPKVLVASVARVMQPGCKMDNVLILEGEQGRGKSTVISILFGEWFTDAPLPIGDKDAYQVIQGKWGFELAELDSFNKAEVTAMKHFFSQQIDRFRPSYGRVAQDHPRQTVFFGTTNQDAYLRDYTGNRRFWPVYCVTVNKDWVRNQREQLWAEAVYLYREGMEWWISQETDEEKRLHDIVMDAQDARLQRDPWEDILRDFLTGKEAEAFTSAELLQDGIGFDAAHIQQAHMNRLGPIMRALGWKSERQRVPTIDGRKVQRRAWLHQDTKKQWDGVPL